MGRKSFWSVGDTRFAHLPPKFSKDTCVLVPRGLQKRSSRDRRPRAPALQFRQAATRWHCCRVVRCTHLAGTARGSQEGLAARGPSPPPQLIFPPGRTWGHFQGQSRTVLKSVPPPALQPVTAWGHAAGVFLLQDDLIAGSWSFPLRPDLSSPFGACWTPLNSHLEGQRLHCYPLAPQALQIENVGFC